MKSLAVIYTRVSSDEQVDNMSLGNQEEACRNFVANQQGDLKVAKVFVEQGESAKSADRTKLKEMLEYCRQNRHTVALVYQVNSFS
ncbi:MAG TPA: recombinase family protein [Candidatus Saccharimonadales bacterium]|jgi:DNA invertase Pin-like site-specific DNA recombinase